MTDHVLRHGALRHFNTQLEQLAVYAGCAPAWIGKTHPADRKFTHACAMYTKPKSGNNCGWTAKNI
jgi:hypothetical protein